MSDLIILEKVNNIIRIDTKLLSKSKKLLFNKVSDNFSSEKLSQVNSWCKNYVANHQGEKTTIYIQEWNLEMYGHEHILPLKEVIENCPVDLSIIGKEAMCQPTIIGVWEKKELTFSGEACNYYMDRYLYLVKSWIDTIFNLKKEITIHYKLGYANYEYLDEINKIFQKLIKSQKGKVTINWYHETEFPEQLETGKELEEGAGIPFNFIPVV